MAGVGCGLTRLGVGWRWWCFWPDRGGDHDEVRHAQPGAFTIPARAVPPKKKPAFHPRRGEAYIRPIWPDPLVQFRSEGAVRPGSLGGKIF